MSNYTKSTNFATKDTLPTGNAGKIIKGTEIDTEFNNIATAIATKVEDSDISAALANVSGRVIQTVISQNGTYSATSATSFVGTGHTATITPTSASSKILVLYSGFMWQTNIYAFSGNVYSTIYRGATNLAGGTNGFTMTNVNTAASPGGASNYGSVAFSYLDSPVSTSALTYQIYIRAENGANAAWNGNGTATIILMEIL